MQDHPLLRLPVFKAHEPPPLPFPPKSWVHLRSCQHGQPGRVQRYWRGLVAVYWPQFDLTGKYKPARLLAAEVEDRDEGVSDEQHIESEVESALD